MTAPFVASPAFEELSVGDLRPVFGELPIMLLVFDAAGACTVSEGGLLQYFGTRPGDNVGRELVDFFAEFPEGANAVRQALAGDTVYTRAVGNGSRSVDIQWMPRRGNDGAIVGVAALATATDVDHDTLAFVRAEGEYRALLQAIPDQVFRLRTDGHAVMVKPANDAGALQLPVDWSPTPLVQSARPEIAEALIAAAVEAAVTGSEQFLDHQVGEPGHERYVEARIIPEADDQVLGIVRDITARRRAESERRESSKLEALGRLSTGVAHEINTPIQFVSHNVEFMSESFQAMHRLLLAYREALHGSESLPWAERSARLHEQEAVHDVEFLLAEVPQAVEDTLDGIRRVATIVRALKQFAHPSTCELQPSDVNDAVRNAVVVATSEYKHVADVELELPALPLVVCDPGGLTQVVLNLIVNAAHALEPLVAQRGRLGRIELSTGLDGEYVAVRVRDDGPGISPDDQERVFDAFFTTKEVGKGTGQGLTLARAIIDKHEGTLTLNSVPGEGTSFEVRLPIAGPPRVREPGGDTPSETGETWS